MFKKPPIIIINGIEGKYCRNCYQWKPLSDYSKYKKIAGRNTEIKYLDHCKKCMSEQPGFVKF